MNAELMSHARATASKFAAQFSRSYAGLRKSSREQIAWVDAQFATAPWLLGDEGRREAFHQEVSFAGEVR